MMSERTIIVENGATYVEKVEKQVLFTNQVTVNQYASDASRKQPEETTSVTMDQPAPVATSYPPSQYDDPLFRKELIISAIKAELGRLMEEEKIEKGEWNIAHWFVVWKMFRHYRFITKENTQAMFVRWVAEVFGWDWKTNDFKGTNVHSSLKNIDFDKWTYDNICGQTAQAEKFIHWKKQADGCFPYAREGWQERLQGAVSLSLV